MVHGILSIRIEATCITLTCRRRFTRLLSPSNPLAARSRGTCRYELYRMLVYPCILTIICVDGVWVSFQRLCIGSFRMARDAAMHYSMYCIIVIFAYHCIQLRLFHHLGCCDTRVFWWKAWRHHSSYCWSNNTIALLSWSPLHTTSVGVWLN